MWWIWCMLVADTLSFTEFVEAAERREMRILNCGCEGIAPLACGAAEWVGPHLTCRLGCGGHEWSPANVFKSGVQLTHLHPLLTPTNSKQTPKEATVSCWRESRAHLFHDTHEAPHLSGSGNKGLPFCLLFFKAGNLELCSASDLSKSEV